MLCDLHRPCDQWDHISNGGILGREWCTYVGRIRDYMNINCILRLQICIDSSSIAVLKITNNHDMNLFSQVMLFCSMTCPHHSSNTSYCYIAFTKVTDDLCITNSFIQCLKYIIEEIQHYFVCAVHMNESFRFGGRQLESCVTA